MRHDAQLSASSRDSSIFLFRDESGAYLAPQLVRIGMFCKLGSLELSRPVAVPVCEKLVCKRPVSGWISFGAVHIRDLKLAIPGIRNLRRKRMLCDIPRDVAAVDLAFAFPRGVGLKIQLSKEFRRAASALTLNSILQASRSLFPAANFLLHRVGHLSELFGIDACQRAHVRKHRREGRSIFL